MNIFEICIDKILNHSHYGISKRNEIPKIFYIGQGKSGSASLLHSFPDVCVGHWHSVEYFEKQYNINVLSKNNLDLYDLIIYIGKKYNFKPLIIESLRENVNCCISYFFHIHNIPEFQSMIPNIEEYHRLASVEEKGKFLSQHVQNKLKGIIFPCYTHTMCEKHFNFSILKNFQPKNKYLFKDFDQVSVLLLRFENIKEWKSIIEKETKHSFIMNHQNDYTTDEVKEIKKHVKLPETFLRQHYSSGYYKNFFSAEEINNYITMFKI